MDSHRDEPWRAWYGLARWKKARAAHLKAHPLCVKCEQQGITEIATLCDYRNPHRGDPALFWDPANYQGLCTTHHSATKQREEERGQVIGNQLSGRPRDPDHPWNITKADGVTRP